MLARALDVVFPRRCAGCGDGTWPFCPSCLLALQPISPPWCARCGAPALLDVPRCRDCPPEEISSVRAPFRYQGPARSAIHRLKFAGWRDVGVAIAEAIASAPGGLPAVDVITWVPLARRRLAERGYDQARALATSLGHQLELPVPRLLRRTVTTGSQAARSGAERRTAMAGVFEATRVVSPRVLLVDDVLTTGATAAACAQALRAAGAVEVHVAVAARASGGGLPRSLRAPVAPAYPG